MRIQACLHLDMDAWRESDGLLRDPWFKAVMQERLGDLVDSLQLIEQTPQSSRAVGARWFHVGKRGRLGLIPVSDGTDVVMQLEEGYLAGLRDWVWHKNQKRLREFLNAVQKRWTGIAPRR